MVLKSRGRRHWVRFLKDVPHYAEYKWMKKHRQRPTGPFNLFYRYVVQSQNSINFNKTIPPQGRQRTMLLN